MKVVRLRHLSGLQVGNLKPSPRYSSLKPAHLRKQIRQRRSTRKLLQNQTKQWKTSSHSKRLIPILLRRRADRLVCTSAISNHTPESSARGTAELQESDTLQPPDRPEAGGIDERRESDAGHSESTLGVDSAEGATDCGREQPQEHPQTGPRRASHDECQAQSNGRSPAPSGISHPRKNILPARKLQVELSDEPGPAYNVHERPRSEFRESTQPRRVEQYAREPTQPQPSHGSFQTFNTNPTVEHQSQPKRYPRLQGERQHQIQPQTSYYSSQYKASARSQDQHQALTQSRQQAPTSHPVPHPQARNKSRMIKGHTYDQSDPELVYDRARCHYLLSQFNSSSSASAGHRRLLAKSLLGGVGEGVEIEVPFRCEYGYNIKVGEGTYIGADCIIEDPSIVFIGSKCVIGPRVSICCKKSSPNLNDHDGSRSLFYAPGIWIEDRVCIEAGVIIHAGVRIGTGSTIVAGSVVTKVRHAIFICHELTR